MDDVGSFAKSLTFWLHLEGPDGFLKKCCDLTNGEMDEKKHGSIKGGQKKQVVIIHSPISSSKQVVSTKVLIWIRIKVHKS